MTAREYGWAEADEYLVSSIVDEDAGLVAARESAVHVTEPDIAVAPNQGALLAILVQMMGATRALEFGTLAGYSTLWLARGVGEHGHVTTLELEQQNADVARANFERAGVADRVDVIVGPAAESSARLIAAGTEPFDFVFIDADKPSTPTYLANVMQLTRPGSVIVIDNVVRKGEVVDPASSDPRVQGIRSALEMISADSRIEATAVQTVGSKGWDGFAILRRRS